MNLPVVMSRRAKQDVQEIWAWIADRSSIGADKWLAALDGCLTCLPDSAVDSTIAPEAEDFGVDLRQRSFKTRHGNTYRLIFTVQARVIYVVAVRGTGQDFLVSEDISFEQ